MASAVSSFAEEPAAAKSLSPQTQEAVRLLASQDSYEREKGFLRLEALREPAALDSIRPFLDSQDPEMRAASLRAVAAIAGAQSSPVLLKALDDRDAAVRRAALLGLEPFQAQDKTILPAFIKALTDRSVEVRMTSVDAVSRFDSPEARAAIRERYKEELHPDVRKVLKMAMQRIDSADGR